MRILISDANQDITDVSISGKYNREPFCSRLREGAFFCGCG